jgi:hypothetical protein
MAQPTIKLLYNSTANDVEYTFSAAGNSDGTFNPVIAVSGTATGSGTVVFTGGGIEPMASGIYPVGTRSATIRPESGTTVIPYTFIEQDFMYKVPLAGPSNYRYCFAVYLGGSITSKLYLEAWDDFTHTTTNLPVLLGTTSNSNVSFIKAKTTTYDYPGSLWTGTPLRGYESRIELSNVSSVSNTVLYFNIYVEIPSDCETFVNMPVLSLRYLYS